MRVLEFREAYQAQKHTARQRGIGFSFTYEEWVYFWGDDIHERGVTGLVMARKGDTGPYSVENVYIVTAKQNLAEITQETWRKAAMKRARTPRKPRNRGKQPNNRPVVGPNGERYGSIAEAAMRAGVPRRTMSARCKRGLEWQLEEQCRGVRVAIRGLQY